MITPMNYKQFANLTEECRFLEEHILKILESNNGITHRAVATVMGHLLATLISQQQDPDLSFKQITERIKYEYKDIAKKLGKSTSGSGSIITEIQ